jgi:hypothetical protein
MILGGRLFDFRMAGRRRVEQHPCRVTSTGSRNVLEVRLKLPAASSGECARSWIHAGRNSGQAMQDKQVESVTDRHLFAMLRARPERGEGPQAWAGAGFCEERIEIFGGGTHCVPLRVDAKLHSPNWSGNIEIVNDLRMNDRCASVTWWNSRKAP